jgi:hypothetical protein
LDCGEFGLLPSDETMIRGQAIRGVLDVLDVVGGPGTMERTIAILPNEIAEAYRYGALVSSGWFPIAWYRELHLAAKRAQPSVPDIHRKLGNVSTLRDLRAVYRFILQIASPAFAFAHANRILGTYFKQCRSEILESRASFVRIQLEIPGASAELWCDIAGGMEAILSVCGGRSGTVSIPFGSNGSVAALDATWVNDAVASNAR